MKELLLFLMATLYIAAGIMHFKRPWFYYKITPPYLKKWQKPINVIVGIAEILGGIGLLIPATQSAAAWGIILLLIAVFPANINMLINEKANLGMKKWQLWLRLPIQFLLIAWAYWYV